MKTVLLPFSTILIAICLFIFPYVGCWQPTGPIEQPRPEYVAFAIDLQDGFQGDSLIIKLDGRVLYERLTTTNSSNGFAFRLVPAVSAGKHQIRVSIPAFSVQADTSLNVQDTLVIGMNFDRGTRRLSFIPYDTWLTYGTCGGIDPLIVPEPPYDSPIWHPSGRFIGFNHTPLREVVYPEPCYPEQVFDYNSTGFWLVNSDGTNMRRIFPHTLLSPAWSPDGQWIAFCVPMGDDVHIFKMRFTGNGFDTTTLVQLTTAGRNFYPAWSPDGQWIAYDSNDESPNGMNFIWLMKSDGSEKKRIVYAPSTGETREPDYSPDGRFIAHQRYINSATGEPEIFIMDASGNTPKQLTFGNYFNSNPKYSSDGTRIAYWSDNNIWLADTTGMSLLQVTTQGVDRSFGLPFSWSPDGNKILYTQYQANDWTIKNGVLWMIDVYSKTETQFTFNNSLE